MHVGNIKQRNCFRLLRTYADRLADIFENKFDRTIRRTSVADTQGAGAAWAAEKNPISYRFRPT